MRGLLAVAVVCIATLGGAWARAASVDDASASLSPRDPRIQAGVRVPSAEAAALTTQQQMQVLGEAQGAYDRGADLLRTDPAKAEEAFREAAAKFQLLVDGGIVNGRLHFNLANAYLQSHQLGRAILEYRRAQELTPGDSRIETNLAQARAQCRDQIPFSGRRALIEKLLFWHYDTPVRWRINVALAAYAAFWGVLLGRIFGGGRGWLYGAVVCAILWIVPGASAASDLLLPSQHGAGVLTAGEVIVRKGNGEGFEPQFAQPLHEGVEFELLERRGEWLQIKLPDDSTGWIRATQAALTHEPGDAA